MIEEAGEIQIRDMPHKLQGAVGKLLAKKLVVRFRKQGKVSGKDRISGRIFVSYKKTNFVKIAEN